jgi:hypothetical protein
MNTRNMQHYKIQIVKQAKAIHTYKNTRQKLLKVLGIPTPCI